MNLGRISKILKIAPTRMSNIELKNFSRILSTSNNSANIIVLQRQKYATNENKSRPWNVFLLKSQYYSTAEVVDSNTFERICEETLHSLAEYFEDLVATNSTLEKGDVTYGSGVLTIDLGNYGTYVINRQSPNKQIWLSSPTSGPKRFDYLVKEDCWIYKHNGQNLHILLQEEFEHIIGKKLEITSCSHSSRTLESQMLKK